MTDPAYRDKRYRTNITDKGISIGTVVHFPDSELSDTFTVESIGPKGKCTVVCDETGERSRVTDSFFAHAEPVE